MSRLPGGASHTRTLMAIYLLDYLADLVRRGDVASEAAMREELRDPMRRYVRRALQGAASWCLGRGHGPLDHFGWG